MGSDPENLLMIDFVLLAVQIVLFGSVDNWFFGHQMDARFFYWGTTLVMVGTAELVVAKRPGFSQLPQWKTTWTPRLWLYGAVTGLTLLLRLRVIEKWPISAQDADMLPLLHKALGRFLAGQNPYGQYLPSQEIPWELWLTFLPGFWMAHLPSFLLGIDLRLWGLLWLLGFVAVHYWYLKDRSSICSWAGIGLLSLLLLVPKSFNFARIGHTFPYWFSIACFCFFALKKKYTYASVWVAIVSIMRILFGPLLLLWLGFLWKKRNALDFRKNVLIVILITLLAQAPFVLMDPWAYYFGTVRWYDYSSRPAWDTPGITHSFGFTGMLHAMGKVEAHRWLQWIVFFPLFGLAWRRTGDESDLLVWMGFLLMMLLFLTPIPHYYIFFPPWILLMFGCMGRWGSREPAERFSE